jgi:hypothetical protein
MHREEALRTFLEIPGVESTNTPAERALIQCEIHRKISQGVHSAWGGIYRRSLLTVTAPPRQQGRDVWSILEQAWIDYPLGAVIPPLLPDHLGGDYIKQARIAPLRGVFQVTLAQEALRPLNEIPHFDSLARMPGGSVP